MLTLKQIDAFLISGKFYLELNLPSIPEELLPLNESNSKIHYREKVLDYGFEHYLNGILVQPPLYSIYRYYETVPLNLIENFVESPGISIRHRINYITTENHNNGIMLPHTDYKRKFAINYFIDTGGENVITSWYRETNKPIYNREHYHVGPKQSNGNEIVKYEDLELLDSVKCQKNKWYIIRTDVIHGVANLNGIRKFISFDL
jgi:hypothetical protein